MSDGYNLHCFLDAQERVYHVVLAELRAGRKSSHWIWFFFPQIANLGHSGMAQQFAIGSLDEASPHYSRRFVTKPPRRQTRRACGAPRSQGILETVC